MRECVRVWRAHVCMCVRVRVRAYVRGAYVRMCAYVRDCVWVGVSGV